VIFETFNVYLTQGGCCIGGYHTAIGVAGGIQTYSEFTYVNHPGVFSQDVSALSHEIGEWVDDPLLNGFTYNLQDLVMLPYFGAPISTSVNGWLGFQDYPLSISSMDPNSRA